MALPHRRIAFLPVALLALAACADDTATTGPARAPLAAAVDAAPLAQWMRAGNAPGATSFALLPDGALLAVNYDHGILRADREALQWTPAGDLSPALQPEVLTVDSRGFVYAGTYEGVMRSRDGGAHWEATGLTGMRIVRLAADERGTVYAAAQHFVDGGVYRSDDEGLHWTRVLEVAGRDAMPTSLHVRRGDVVVGLYAQVPMYGREGGLTWEPLLSLFGEDSFLGAEDATPTPGGALLVAGAMGILRSADAGQSWKATLPGVMVTDLLVDEANGVIYALRGGGAVDRSTDDGATWQPVAAPLRATDWTPDALARTASGHLVTANWKGIWRSTATVK